MLAVILYFLLKYSSNIKKGCFMSFSANSIAATPSFAVTLVAQYGQQTVSDALAQLKKTDYPTYIQYTSFLSLANCTEYQQIPDDLGQRVRDAVELYANSELNARSNQAPSAVSSLLGKVQIETPPLLSSVSSASSSAMLPPPLLSSQQASSSPTASPAAPPMLSASNNSAPALLSKYKPTVVKPAQSSQPVESKNVNGPSVMSTLLRRVTATKTNELPLSGIQKR
jgi:hypothetical protein